MLIWSGLVKATPSLGGTMEENILYGKPVANRIEEFIRNYINELPSGSKTPGLVIIRVGEDPASEAYVRGKIKACERVGINSNVIHLEEFTTQDKLLSIIDLLNKDESVHGILVQLPLPKHINESVIANSINSNKDVDCFTATNLGLFYSGEYKIAPCTPLGVMNLLAHYDINVEGKRVAIIGRSLIAGKPMAEMILQHNGTPTILHSKTAHSDYMDILRESDIIISATGRPHSINHNTLLDNDMARAKVCIDIGISRVDGKLVGDFDSESLKNHSRVTPVPSGTGLTTVASLLLNTLECYKMLEEDY